jgi:hypothetical protein
MFKKAPSNVHTSPIQSDRKPHGYWQIHQHKVDFVKELERKLGITKVEDWYSKTTKELRPLGIGSWLSK